MWGRIFTGVVLCCLAACGDEPSRLQSGELSVELTAERGLVIKRAGVEVLRSNLRDTRAVSDDPLRAGDSYGAFAASVTQSRRVTDVYGSFKFDDRVKDYSALSVAEVEGDGDSLQFELSGGARGVVSLEGDWVRIGWETSGEADSRLAMSFVCGGDDRFFGLGAQVSAEHRGYRVPVWTSEQGNSKAPQGEPAEVFGLTGAHYASYAPVPFTLSSRPAGFWLDTTYRSEFELCQDDSRLRFEVQGPRFELVVFTGASMAEVVSGFTAATGRPSQVSRWTYAPWVDSTGGPAGVEKAAADLRDHDIPASAIWAEDWVGTLFSLGGEHLTYNWEVNDERYPDLKGLTDALHDQGIRFLAYFNPYLPDDTRAFREGEQNGYLVADQHGGVIKLDFPFGEPPSYYDMTGAGAREWYWGFLDAAVDAGVDGWMADYGESLPYKCRMADGRLGAEAHNDYPRMWAAANRDFWDSRAPDGDYAFFTRSGFTGVAAQTHIHWLGDQLTDFDRNDGLGSVIPLYLSAGLSGIALTHSDVGGYTSTFGMERSFELWARWLELEAFTPFMRTHHSASPDNSIQWNSSAESLDLFGRYARWHQRLMPYFSGLVDEAVVTGAPPVRPIWWGHEERADLFSVDDQFLVGPDLLVAPVIEEGSTQRQVVLPDGRWRRWRAYEGDLDPALDTGTHGVEAGVSEAIVFVRAGAALPVLTQDYDTLAVQRVGEDYGDRLMAAPADFDSIGFILIGGGSSSGALTGQGLGEMMWSWEADDVMSGALTEARVDGAPLPACPEADGGLSCIRGDTIYLRSGLELGVRVEVASSTGVGAFTVTAEGPAEIELDWRP